MPPVRPRQRRNTQRVTMSDVARLADVSASTVSLYLRKPDEVSSVLRQRIQHAIDSLGYVPNLMAGALAAARTRVIGVIVPSMVNSLFASTVKAMQEPLRRRGYQLLLGHSDYSPAEEEALVRTFLSWSPAAMIVTGLSHSRKTGHLLSHGRQPVVEMWELGAGALDLAVGFSHLDVGRAQTRHLVDQGCRHIAFVGARMQADNRAGQRADGYRTTLRDFLPGCHPVVLDVGTQPTAEASSHVFQQLLADAPETDGVIFSNDLLALGATFAAQRLGIRIPQDVAVLGFGDMDFSASSLPRITTVRPPREAIGQRVAELVLARLDGNEVEAVNDLGFDLIVRESSARVPEGTEQAEHFHSLSAPAGLTASEKRRGAQAQAGKQ